MSSRPTCNVFLSSRWARRALPILAAILIAGCQSSSAPRTSAPPLTPCAPPESCPGGGWNPQLGPKPVPTAGKLDATGALVFPRRNTLVAIDVQTRAVRTLVEFPRQAALSSPAPSPDRTRVALTVYTPSTEPQSLGGADLYIVDLADGSSRLLVEHGEAGVWLSDPAWTADGQTVYYTRRAAIMQDGRYRGEDISIQRIAVGGAGPERVVQNASSPSISADGQLLAYLGPIGGTQPAKLWVAGIDGQSPREVVGSAFSQLGTPRFAPRGSRLAFTGVGGPPNTPVQKLSSLIDGLLPVVHAHGTPWDLWVVNPDGSELTRLTDVGEDGPVPAWAPDGSSIAFSGEVGLYVVDLKTGETTMLAQEPASGLVWVPSA